MAITSFPELLDRQNDNIRKHSVHKNMNETAIIISDEISVLINIQIKGAVRRPELNVREIILASGDFGIDKITETIYKIIQSDNVAKYQ